MMMTMMTSFKWKFYGNIERLKWPTSSNCTVGFGRQDIENDEILLLLIKDQNHQICLFGRDFQFTPNLSSWQECLGCFELWYLDFERHKFQQKTNSHWRIFMTKKYGIFLKMMLRRTIYGRTGILPSPLTFSDNFYKQS